ncbi:MAG: phosphodiester glycosidase family protein [Ignavibacteria bacterium]|nr:phosphodiester glycosidase family protein [Ignavibacteria bacterium]
MVTSLITDTCYAKKKPAKGKVVSKSKTKTSKKNSKKSKAPAVRPAQPSSHIFIQDTMLCDGIYHKQLIATINGIKHCVNIIQIDIINKKATVGVVKGGNNITELERLPDMLPFIPDDTASRITMGGINANLWRAYTNYPIGPTIIDGEVAEMMLYKKWTSTFFNEEGIPFTNTFAITGELLTKTGSRISISAVNRRPTSGGSVDTNGVVVYNRLGGDFIPYINSKKAQELMLAGMDNLFQDGQIVDSTESIDQLELSKTDLLDAERSNHSEYNTRKIVVQYIDQPAVNTFIKCQVTDITTGAVKMPDNGFIISIGANFDETLLPNVKDVITLHYWTNVNESEVFTNAVCGIPRLVRDGIARHEAYEEGSVSKRFINGALPRSAIGYNKDKSKVFLVSVTGNKADGTTGASLAQLAEIMEYIGCYTAQNLDGGGSTNMVVCGDNIINPTTSRRVSVALSAVKLKHEKVQKLPQRKRR